MTQHVFKAYYELTKPGIIYGNALSAIAGFFLASKGVIDVNLFAAMLIGLSFIIASSCVFNNYIDRDIDIKMGRTKKRALVTGEISPRNALFYAIILSIVGSGVLAAGTNLLTVGVALFGSFMYVIVYGIWKRRSVNGTLIGSISGAIPPVVGYCAVTNELDLGALLLFFILVAWQMPHFYAIAIYRHNDYAAASIPVLPLVKGIVTTKFHMIFYVVVFVISTILMTVFGYTGYVYLVIISIAGLAWIGYSLSGFSTENDKMWARIMFRYSLVILLLFCIVISINNVLP